VLFAAAVGATMLQAVSLVIAATARPSIAASTSGSAWSWIFNDSFNFSLLRFALSEAKGKIFEKNDRYEQ
jgi:hypothetical protein